MTKWLQRLRGALGMGLTWAVGWAPVGAITGWITGMVFGFPLVGIALNYTVMFGFLGFVGGGIFSAFLSLAEGHRLFNQLSSPRFVTWGALGGVLLGGMAVALGLVGLQFSPFGALITGVAALLGAGSAAGTLAIARAGETPTLIRGDAPQPVLAPRPGAAVLDQSLPL